MQGGARHLLPGERVQGCGRWLTYGYDAVELWHLPAVQRARFVGVQTCGSVWLCPVCAAKISERRKKELEQALCEVKRRGWVTLFLTYTVPHWSGDDLATLLDAVSKARGKATQSKQAKKLLDRCGVVGHVRALEITHGENGWHPHIHELMFVRSDEHLGKLLAGLQSQWARAVSKVGLRAVNEHGFGYTVADTDIAEYVAKFGHDRAWNVEHELTKQVTKEGRRAGRTPMELLGAFTFDGDLQAGALYCHYGRCMKGRRQLVWSRGLRADLGLVEEKSDQDLAEESDQAGVLLAVIPWQQWQMILADGANVDLLAAAASGDRDAVAELLSRYRPVEVGRRVKTWRVKLDKSEEAQEARRLGLTKRELLQYRYRGISAIAEAASSPARTSLATEDGRRRGSGRGVRRCDEETGASQAAMCL